MLHQSLDRAFWLVGWRRQNALFLPGLGPRKKVPGVNEATFIIKVFSMKEVHG